jgi:hypothetical protein
MSDEKYKQEARHSWQEIASIAESVPESASYIHGFIDGMKIGNKELEHRLEMAIETLEFYGNIDSWYQDDMDIFDYTILPSDVEQKIHPKTGNSHIAGKRARQALEQLK